MIIFTEWLKEQGAYDEYMRYFDDKWGNFPYTIPMFFIENAFDWDEADSEYDYWSQLNDEWQRRHTLSLSVSRNSTIVFSKEHLPVVSKIDSDTNEGLYNNLIITFQTLSALGVAEDGFCESKIKMVELLRDAYIKLKNKEG
jgi:hypothetical protein